MLINLVLNLQQCIIRAILILYKTQNIDLKSESLPYYSIAT